MKNFVIALLIAIAASIPIPQTVRAETQQAEREWIDPAGISGSLVICGGGQLPDSVYKTFLKRAGGENARLVIVPTASANANKTADEEFASRWIDLGAASVKVLHTRERAEADDPKFLAPLQEATGVWFGGGQQSRLASAYQGTEFEAELQNLLKRGGVIGGTSAGAAIQSRVMIAGGKEKPNIQTGLDLLPGAIIDQHFSERNRQPRLRLAVTQHPDRVGLGIDEGTALLVGTRAGRFSASDRGRTIRVMGKGEVTVILAASSSKPMREYRLGEGGLLDLTQLRRAARERLEDFPPAETAEPGVPSGSLVIFGGGRLPGEIVEEIIELAGGPDAKIVALPTGYEPERMGRDSSSNHLRRAGAKNIKILPAFGLEAVSSPEFAEAINEADCVWFGGGRHWRFVDAYDGTPAVELFHGVLKRGGVICGGSAGASIQSEYLARADALTNRRIMAEGYQQGFGFLPGTAIDQHFAQRNRFGDLGRFVETYPQFLGIGVDEATAIVVRGQTAQVMGENKVHFFDGKKGEDGRVSFDSVAAGFGYDLKERKTFGPAIAEKPGEAKRQVTGKH